MPKIKEVGTTQIGEVPPAEKVEPTTGEPTGVGADIFIRKRLPGATVGVGYEVEIYENGVKQDEVVVKKKDDVIKIIQSFKDKYQTDRAFQNINQLHITYKTKEERGELHDPTRPTGEDAARV